MFTVIARDATLRKLLRGSARASGHARSAHGPRQPQALRRAPRSRRLTEPTGSGRPVAVLYLDLDGFKDVNDVFGHQAGDRVLSETSRRLEAVIRPGDIVARHGRRRIRRPLREPRRRPTMRRRSPRGSCRPSASRSRSPPGVATVTASVGIALGEPGETAASLVGRARRSDVPDEAGREGGLPVRGRGRRLSRPRAGISRASGADDLARLDAAGAGVDPAEGSRRSARARAGCSGPTAGCSACARTSPTCRTTASSHRCRTRRPSPSRGYQRPTGRCRIAIDSMLASRSCAEIWPWHRLDQRPVRVEEQRHRWAEQPVERHADRVRRVEDARVRARPYSS